MNVFKTSLMAAVPAMVIADERVVVDERVGESNPDCPHNHVEIEWDPITGYVLNEIEENGTIEVNFWVQAYDSIQGCVVEPTGQLIIDSPEGRLEVQLTDDNTEFSGAQWHFLRLLDVPSYFPTGMPDGDFTITFDRNTLTPSFPEPLTFLISSYTVIVKPARGSTISLFSANAAIHIELNHLTSIPQFDSYYAQYVAESGEVISVRLWGFDLRGHTFRIYPPDGGLWPVGNGTLNLFTDNFMPNMRENVSFQVRVPEPNSVSIWSPTSAAHPLTTADDVVAISDDEPFVIEFSDPVTLTDKPCVFSYVLRGTHDNPGDRFINRSFTLQSSWLTNGGKTLTIPPSALDGTSEKWPEESTRGDYLDGWANVLFKLHVDAIEEPIYDPNIWVGEVRFPAKFK